MPMNKLSPRNKHILSPTMKRRGRLPDFHEHTQISIFSRITLFLSKKKRSVNDFLQVSRKKTAFRRGLTQTNTIFS